MSGNWFLEHDGKTYGPLTSKQLRQLATRGKLNRDSKVRVGGDSRWHRAAKIKGLFPENDPIAKDSLNEATQNNEAKVEFSKRQTKIWVTHFSRLFGDREHSTAVGQMMEHYTPKWLLWFGRIAGGLIAVCVLGYSLPALWFRYDYTFYIDPEMSSEHVTFHGWPAVFMHVTMICFGLYILTSIAEQCAKRNNKKYFRPMIVLFQVSTVGCLILGVIKYLIG